MSRRGRPPVDKTIAQCRLSGVRGGKAAVAGRDRARRKSVPVTIAKVPAAFLTAAKAASEGG